MATKQQKFFDTLGPLARNEYLSRAKWVLPSICLAQAALESGYNLKAKTLFGIKAKAGQASTVLTTTEFYNNNKVTIDAAFAAYPDIASAVVGYYDLVTGLSYYKDMVNNLDYKSAIHGINGNGDRDDMDGLAMYATDPSYESKIIKIIEQYNLTEWDKREDALAQPKPTPETSEQEQVHIVKDGDTLNKIAKNYEVTVEQIAMANNIKNVNLIKIGQKLIIPRAGYQVKVTAHMLNVRNGIGTINTRILATVCKGDVLRITKEQDGWGLSQKGWINLKYTEKI